MALIRPSWAWHVAEGVSSPFRPIFHDRIRPSVPAAKTWSPPTAIERMSPFSTVTSRAWRGLDQDKSHCRNVLQSQLNIHRPSVCKSLTHPPCGPIATRGLNPALGGFQLKMSLFPPVLPQNTASTPCLDLSPSCVRESTGRSQGIRADSSLLTCSPV